MPPRSPTRPTDCAPPRLAVCSPQPLSPLPLSHLARRRRRLAHLSQAGRLRARGVRLRFVGALDMLPEALRLRLLAAAATPPDGPQQLLLCIAVSYGGREEVRVHAPAPPPSPPPPLRALPVRLFSVPPPTVPPHRRLPIGASLCACRWRAPLAPSRPAWRRGS